MANLYDILESAQGGTAIPMLGRQFGLTPEQTQAAVTALLPAISTGLKRSTATPEGLGNLFGAMARQQDLRAMYDEPETAFSQKGQAAGNDVLSVIFGSTDVSRAVADQAQKFSGVDSSILKKLLPVLAGVVMSGMMGGKSGTTAPSATPSSTGGGASLWDILGQVFGQGLPGQAGTSPTPPQQAPAPGGQPLPVPMDTSGSPTSGGGLLEQILREVLKGVQEGRIKPVVVEVPMPGGQNVPAPQTPGGDMSPLPQASGPTGSGGEMLPGPKAIPVPQTQGGDFLGQILRDLLGGSPGAAPRIPQSVGAAVFGERIEPGRDVDQKQIDDIQKLFDRFFSTR